MCNNMAKSQKHFPQLHKPDKNVHSFLFHIFEIPQNTVAERSRLIPKELKRTLGRDRICLFILMFIPVYTFVKTHQILHFKWVKILL